MYLRRDRLYKFGVEIRRGISLLRIDYPLESGFPEKTVVPVQFPGSRVEADECEFIDKVDFRTGFKDSTGRPDYQGLLFGVFLTQD